MTRQFSFFAPAAVMSAWATVMLHTYATGHLNRLLSPMFRNYVLVAAVVLVVLSLLHLLLYQPSAESAPGPSGHLRSLGRWLVLLLPVLAAAVLSPSALSSTTANVRGGLSTTPQGVTPMPSWNVAKQASAKEVLDADPNQPAPVEVTDLITLSQNPDQAKAFEGRRVRTVGLFAAEPGSSPKLVRWIMFCCAADAQPAAVELSGNPGQHNGTDWLEVVGKAHFPTVLGTVVPQIEVESIQPAHEPDEPFLSP